MGTNATGSYSIGRVPYNRLGTLRVQIPSPVALQEGYGN